MGGWVLALWFEVRGQTSLGEGDGGCSWSWFCSSHDTSHSAAHLSGHDVNIHSLSDTIVLLCAACMRRSLTFLVPFDLGAFQFFDAR